MRLFQVARKLSIFTRGESGVTLIEAVVALAVLGTIAVTFLSGLATTYKAVTLADKQTTSESLARSQMEWVRNAAYVYDTTEYSPAPIPGGGDYVNYITTITAEPLHASDDGIQKITVTVKHFDKAVIKLDGYKVDR